eukprot:77547-Prorocentrum_minimum.AAC.5
MCIRDRCWEWYDVKVPEGANETAEKSAPEEADGGALSPRSTFLTIHTPRRCYALSGDVTLSTFARRRIPSEGASSALARHHNP